MIKVTIEIEDKKVEIEGTTEDTIDIDILAISIENTLSDSGIVPYRIPPND